MSGTTSIIAIGKAAETTAAWHAQPRTARIRAAASRGSAAFCVLHATTPIDPTRMHYFWMVAWDLPPSEPQREAMLRATLAGFQENKDMLEANQAWMLADPRRLACSEVVVNSDQSAIQARRQLHRHLDQDQPSALRRQAAPA